MISTFHPTELAACMRITPQESQPEANVRHVRSGVKRANSRYIHKAKGQEFDHVIVAHCSASPFPDAEEARRLLYVAISRARRSVTILASGRALSPLLP